MKENIKKMVLGSFIFYVLAIAILMIFNYNNVVVEVDLSDSEASLEKLNKYKKQVQVLEKNDCTKVINDMIDYYEKTSFNGIVNVNEKYDYDMENGGLRFFSLAREKCNLKDDDIEKYNLPLRFMAYVIPIEHSYQEYMFQYEISLKDAWTRLIASAELDDVDYNINRHILLEIIDNLLEIYNERMAEHE